MYEKEERPKHHTRSTCLFLTSKKVETKKLNNRNHINWTLNHIENLFQQISSTNFLSCCILGVSLDEERWVFEKVLSGVVSGETRGPIRTPLESGAPIRWNSVSPDGTSRVSSVKHLKIEHFLTIWTRWSRATRYRFHYSFVAQCGNPEESLGETNFLMVRLVFRCFTQVWGTISTSVSPRQECSLTLPFSSTVHHLSGVGPTHCPSRNFTLRYQGTWLWECVCMCVCVLCVFGRAVERQGEARRGQRETQSEHWEDKELSRVRVYAVVKETGHMTKIIWKI